MKKVIRIVRDFELDPVIGTTGREICHAYNINFGFMIDDELFFFTLDDNEINLRARSGNDEFVNYGTKLGETELDVEVLHDRIIRMLQKTQVAFYNTPEPYLNELFEEVCGVNPKLMTGSIGNKIACEALPPKKHKTPKSCIVI